MSAGLARARAILADWLGLLAHPPGPPRAPRYLSLDAWRGVACLVVIVFHAAFYAGTGTSAGLPSSAGPRAGPAFFVLATLRWMWLGVPMFFVISGYCIAATADSARRSTRPLGDFFLRRVRRIYPPYWTLWALTAAVVWALPQLLGARGLPIHDPARLSGYQWLGNLTLTEIWRPHLGGGPARLMLDHAWTLCYEEQFYLVCGLILLLARRRFFLGVVLVSLGVAATAPFSFKHVGFLVDGFFFDGSWLLFAAGALVFHRRNYASPALGRAIDAALALGALLAVLFRSWALARLRMGEWERLLAAQFLCGSLFALLLTLVQRWDAPFARSWPGRLLAACGRRCYSLYLVHYPVASVLTYALFTGGVTGLWPTLGVTVPIVSAASLAAGFAFHWLVERHFLNPPVTTEPAAGLRARPQRSPAAVGEAG